MTPLQRGTGGWYDVLRWDGKSHSDKISTLLLLLCAKGKWRENENVKTKAAAAAFFLCDCYSAGEIQISLDVMMIMFQHFSIWLFTRFALSPTQLSHSFLGLAKHKTVYRAEGEKKRQHSLNYEHSRALLCKNGKNVARVFFLWCAPSNQHKMYYICTLLLQLSTTHTSNECSVNQQYADYCLLKSSRKNLQLQSSK